MLKILIAIAVFAYTSVFSTFSGAEPLKVGLIGGLTGPVAPYGAAAKNGLLMAIEKNQAGGFIGIQLEDDEVIPSCTVSAYQKLKARGKLDVIIATGSTPALALAPIAARDRVPFIACASDERISKEYPNVLRNWVTGGEDETRAREGALGRFKVVKGPAGRAFQFELQVKEVPRGG